MPVKPVRPGTYITIVGQKAATSPIGGGSTVAVPFQHDWGPVGVGAPLQSIFDFESVYGTSQTDGRQAVLEALTGAGGTGAGAVLPVRLGSSSQASATLVLNNTSSASALTLTAKYPGVRGNRLIPAVIDYAPDATRNVLQLYTDTYSGDPLEQFIHVDGDINGLAAAINLTSQYVTATVNSAAAPLALSGATPASMAGGVDPSPLSADYVTALNALQVQEFSVIAFQNLTSSSIQATVLAWVRQMASRDQPVIWVVGGDTSDTLSSAITRSAALADPHVINVGVGQYIDDYKGGAIVSTAQLAPRIAGAFIGRGDTRSLTFARIEGIRPVPSGAGTPAPTLSEIEQAIQNGVTVFSRSLSPDADLKVEKGLTTFTSTTDPNRPLDIFSDPRLVRVTDLFLRGLKIWGDENIIGGQPVTDDLRGTVLVELLRRITELSRRGLIVPGTAAADVPSPADPQLADAVPFTFSWQYTRTANYLLGQGRVR